MPSVAHAASRSYSAPVPVVQEPHTRTATRRASLGTPLARTRTPVSQTLFNTVSKQQAQIAEHPFFASINAGTLPLCAYVRYLSDRLVICTALEEALKKAHKRLGTVASLHFNRREAVIDDLNTLRTFPLNPSPAALRLEARILAANPNEVLGHAWVEYMGMLNAGQNMQPKLHELFGTASFVTFSESAQAVRDRYTRTLNARHMTGFEVEDMCDEAHDAFAMHADVLDDNFNPIKQRQKEAQALQPTWWQTWHGAFAWVPRLFGVRGQPEGHHAGPA